MTAPGAALPKTLKNGLRFPGNDLQLQQKGSVPNLCMAIHRDVPFGYPYG
jgi:hypothetical protein